MHYLTISGLSGTSENAHKMHYLTISGLSGTSENAHKMYYLTHFGIPSTSESAHKMYWTILHFRDSHRMYYIILDYLALQRMHTKYIIKLILDYPALQRMHKKCFVSFWTTWHFRECTKNVLSHSGLPGTSENAQKMYYLTHSHYPALQRMHTKCII